MKINLNDLPNEVTPGKVFGSISVKGEIEYYYVISLFENGNYKELSVKFSFPYDALYINPLQHYEGELEKSGGQDPKFVIIRIDNKTLMPEPIYIWNKDHWRKVENVRTNNG